MVSRSWKYYTTWLQCSVFNILHEGEHLVRWCTMYSGISSLIFQICLLLPSSGQQVTYCPDGEGSKHLCNICKLKPDYIVQPRRQFLHICCHKNLKSHILFHYSNTQQFYMMSENSFSKENRREGRQTKDIYMCSLHAK
jgi:hypothetical protein